MLVARLIDQVARQEIGTFYEDVQFSYEEEREYQKSGAGAERRDRFIAAYEMAADSSDLVLRLFNQVNYFYAQRAYRGIGVAAGRDFLIGSNALLLHRQGKPLGARVRDISYGVRKDIDIMDVRRRYKALLGLPPALIEPGLAAWCRALRHSNRCLEAAVVLMLALIAIHPFSDGNGRLARLAFSWTLMQWRLPLAYMTEGEDGEFLRVGSGVESTENRMRAAVAELCGDANVIVPGAFERHTAESGLRMLQVLSENLSALSNTAVLPTRPALGALLKHYGDGGHITPEIQSFRCL